MTSLFGRLKSNASLRRRDGAGKCADDVLTSHQGPTSPTSGSAPTKKAASAAPLSALDQLIQDAGPLREDGTDKFFGMHNPSNTCYFNSVVQCLYYSEPFRENVMNFPARLPQDEARALGARSSKPPVIEGVTPADVASGGPITSATANTKVLSSLWGQSKDKVMPLAAAAAAGTPSAAASASGDKADDKNSFEYMKKQAFISGPHITLTDSNAAMYDMSDSLFTSLKDMFEAVIAHDARTGIITPWKALEILKRNYDIFRAPVHQDAHEFLNLLLNEVVASVEAASKKASQHAGGDLLAVKASWVHELFEGTLTSETRCLTCENTSQRDEIFLDLSVDLEEHSSVTACLRKFSEEEMLCERNKFHCDKCGGLQEAEKRMKIRRLPRILALHLKRFKYIEELDRMQKLFHRVVYPFFLRLPNTTDDADDPDRLYELYAVIVHLGSTPFHGHYVAVVKTQRNGWMLLDDELVMPVDKNYVRQFFSGDARNPACAYVLFYQETTDDALGADRDLDDPSEDVLQQTSQDAAADSLATPIMSPTTPTPYRHDDADPFVSLAGAVAPQPSVGNPPLPSPALEPIKSMPESPVHEASELSAQPKAFKLSSGSFKLRHPSLSLRQRPKFWGSKDRTNDAVIEHAVAEEPTAADPAQRTQQIISPNGETRESKLKNRFSLGKKKSGQFL